MFEYDQTRKRLLNVMSPPRAQSTQSRPLCPQGFREFKKAEIEQCVSNRFEQQVEKYADSLSVKCATESLTYNQLNRRANRIAHAIFARRRPTVAPVAFLLEQGTPAIATILGILKSGGFFLALDPTYPADWLTAILKDTQYPLIITNNANLRSAIALGYETDKIMNIDEIDPNLPDNNPGLLVSPDSFAYLYYTSGSTGRPKGVAQSHRHALHQVMTYTNCLRLSARDRCTLLHSHNFSASRLDIFGALLNGAALLPLSVATEGALRLSRWLREEEVSIFHWVPSAFRHFLDAGSETFPSVRMLILGSEPVTSREVALYKRHFPEDCTFVNRFGTTETGNICLCFIDKNTELGAEVVPVGFALEDVEVLLLDEAGADVGYGQVGEIAVRSPYLSGYWRQREITPARFYADADSPSKTIYRSGDLGYRLPDGCLVHVGRNDLQVKVRGHRVELGRVERVLAEYPGVREAAVVAHGEPPDGTRLVAYIVTKDEIGLTSSALRGFLETRLPAFMVPEIFIRLSSLPTTPAGKLDRRTLPDPAVDRLAAAGQYVAPRNELENKLALIWSEILDVPRVGVQDKFLDLGGHSLRAIKIISRVSEVCEREISAREFFDHPTVAQLAEFLSPDALQDMGNEELAGILLEIESISEKEALESVKTGGR